MRKILPTVKKSKITLYTHHALPLQIPFITKETESWFMSCFINVFYRYEFPTFYDYTDYNVFYRDIMLMYGKEASNRKQEIDRQHYTIPNQRPKDKHCGKI